MKNIQNQLFVITILFFVLGILHISLAVLGLICFMLPFIQYFKYKDKVWCKYYCPRAGFFNRVISKINIGVKPPKFFSKKGTRTGVVVYFCINMFFIIMSTIMVSIGKVAPMEQVRFLIAFAMPFELPQLFSLNVPTPFVHLGYRVYSMMFTSVIIGSILGIIYRPRTWCAVCPVNTLTTKKKAKI